MHGNALDDTGIVYQNINLTHFLVNLLNEGLHLIFVCNVADISVSLDARLLVRSQTAVYKFLLDIIEYDVLDAGSMECLGNIETDTIRSACNPGVLAFK